MQTGLWVTCWWVWTIRVKASLGSVPLKSIDPALFLEIWEKCSNFWKLFQLGSFQLNFFFFLKKGIFFIFLFLYNWTISQEEALSQAEKSVIWNEKILWQQTVQWTVMWGLQLGRGNSFLRQRNFQHWPCQWLSEGKSNLIHSKDELEFYSKIKKKECAASTKPRWTCEFWKCNAKRTHYVFFISLLCAYYFVKIKLGQLSRGE